MCRHTDTYYGQQFRDLTLSSIKGTKTHPEETAMSDICVMPDLKAKLVRQTISALTKKKLARMDGQGRCVSSRSFLNFKYLHARKKSS
jgi:hypothetical protein